jgi:hypothetical protein
MESTLSDIYGFMKTAMSGQLAQEMGCSWPGSTGPRLGVVDLEDSFGSHVEVPAMLC